MKNLPYVAVAVFLSGCSFPPEYQTAINNYAKSECDSRQGKLIYVTGLAIHGTLSSSFSFNCVTEKGVETFTNQVKTIPVQYWSKDEN